MDGEDQGIAAQQRQREVKPKMRALIVNYVRAEFVDLRNQAANVVDLPKGLAQPRVAEGNQAHSRIQFGDMRLDDLVGHHQQHFGVPG